MAVRIGILTISDRVSQGTVDDLGGPAIAAALAGNDFEVIRTQVVPDEVDDIALVLRSWADDGLDVILTTGGTGLGPRDVTPDATLQVAERAVPGMAEALRSEGQKRTPHAMLSRGVAAMRGTTLIVNLPGSPSGASDGAQFLRSVLPHAVSIMHGGKH